MTKRKLITLGLAVFMIFAMLTGCSVNKYNAMMYSQSNDWVLQSFLEDNKVRGAYYENKDYVEDESGLNNRYYEDTISPENRTFIIDNQDSYDAVFKKNTLTIDFEKENVYLYVFADSNPYRKYYIKKIVSDNDELSVYYKLEYKNKADTTMPYQRCLIVVMEKTNVSSVKFIKQR